MVDCQKIQEFDTVMQLHVNFKRTQKHETPTCQACNVSAIQGHGAVDKARGDVVVGDKVDDDPC